MGLLDWLSDGLMGSGSAPDAGNPMQPGPGSLTGGVDQMGNSTGQSMPLPTPAPAPTQPMPPVQGQDSGAPPLAPAMPGGGPAPAPQDASPPVPLPQPRPPGADAGAPMPQSSGGGPVSAPPTDISAQGQPPGPPMSLAPPGSPPGGVSPTSPLDSQMPQGRATGILGRALGLDADTATRARGSLAAGLKSVGDNANKPGLAAFAGSMGSSIEGGDKAQNTTQDQRLKFLNTAITAQKNNDTAGYTKAMTDYYKAKAVSEQTKAADPAAASKAASAMSPEAILFKTQQTLSTDPQIKAAKEILVNTQKNGDPKATSAAQKSLDDLYKAKQQTIQDSLKPGTATNPYKPTSADDATKKMQAGDLYINPADGKLYKFKGASAAPSADPTKAATADDEEE